MKKKNFILSGVLIFRTLNSCSSHTDKLYCKDSDPTTKLEKALELLAQKGIDPKSIGYDDIQMNLYHLNQEKKSLCSLLFCRNHSLEHEINELIDLFYNYANKIQKYTYDDYYYFMEFGGAYIRKETWNKIQKSGKLNPIKLMLGCGQSFVQKIFIGEDEREHNHYEYITFDLDILKLNNTDIKGDLQYTIDAIYEESCSEIVSEYLSKDVFTEIFIEKLYKKLIPSGKLIVIGGGLDRFTEKVIKKYGFEKYLYGEKLVLTKK